MNRKIKNIVLNNFGLKIFSLIMAIVLWFYVIGELNRLALEGEMGVKGGVSYKIAAKVFPIIVDITGEPLPGYRVDNDKITITPQVCNAIGLKRLLDRIEYINTVPIDVSEYTKTTTVRVSLRSPARGIKIVDKAATVVIPIEKIEKPKEEVKEVNTENID